MPSPNATDFPGLIRDTVREALRSWRLPATLVLGVAFGIMEYHYTGRILGFFFGPCASTYTLLLGPLPWRALLPLEEDGHRGEKFIRGAVAGLIGTALYVLLVGTYRLSAHTLHVHAIYTLGYPRELLVAWFLFLIGGWGLARDFQLEQRLDVTLGSHEKISAELAEARLNALRADLDPHFLFNALNAIASQCTVDPVAAEDNVVRLATLLRAVLDTRRRALHPLEDELSLARDYVGLLSARFPSLRVKFDADPRCATLEVPPLVLQPLLENAVRHGRFETGEILVRARIEEQALVLTVESPGAFAGPREGGMGIDLVRRRVELAWGRRGSFTIAARGESTVATITARDSLGRKNA